MKTLLLFAAAGGSLLGACSFPGATDPESRYYEIPAGASVVVRQNIAIGPGSAHAVLQDGKIVTSGFRRYQPYCEIEVDDVFEHEQQVRPGRFAVRKVVRQQDWAANLPVQLAASSLIGISIGRSIHGPTRFSMDDRDDRPFVLKVLHLRLGSREQPNVRELRCTGGWNDPSNAVYPTLAEMRQVLGGLISIEIP